MAARRSVVLLLAAAAALASASTAPAPGGRSDACREIAAVSDEPATAADHRLLLARQLSLGAGGARRVAERSAEQARAGGARGGRGRPTTPSTT